MLKSEATLYVGNLPWRTTEEDLVRLFAEFAEVISARIMRDLGTGRSHGYGFVELAAGEQLEAVCARLQGCQLNGRCLEVRAARPQPDRH